MIVAREQLLQANTNVNETADKTDTSRVKYEEEEIRQHVYNVMIGRIPRDAGPPELVEAARLAIEMVPGEEEKGGRGGEQAEVQPDQSSLREGHAPPCRITECPLGHPLHGTYADGAFRCDGCRTSIWKGRNMMYCEGCDYSVCLLCHTQDSQFARLADLGSKKEFFIKKMKKESG